MGASAGRLVLRHIPVTCSRARAGRVHTPDLIGHGRDKEGADRKLVGMGLADYRADFAAVLKTLPPQPVVLGHSMGALLAQQLAASGSRARAHF